MTEAQWRARAQDCCASLHARSCVRGPVAQSGVHACAGVCACFVVVTVRPEPSSAVAPWAPSAGNPSGPLSSSPTPTFGTWHRHLRCRFGKSAVGTRERAHTGHVTGTLCSSSSHVPHVRGRNFSLSTVTCVGWCLAQWPPSAFWLLLLFCWRLTSVSSFFVGGKGDQMLYWPLTTFFNDPFLSLLSLPMCLLPS